MIVSTTRSNSAGNIGFVGNQARLNVMLTRARLSNIVVGDSSTLCGDDLWNSYYNHVKEHGCVFSLKKHLHLVGKKLDPVRKAYAAVEAQVNRALQQNQGGFRADRAPAVVQEGGGGRAVAAGIRPQRLLPVEGESDQEVEEEEEEVIGVAGAAQGDDQNDDQLRTLAQLRPWLDEEHEDHHNIFRLVMSEKVVRFFGNRNFGEKNWIYLALSRLFAGVGMKIHTVKKDYMLNML